MGTTEARDDIRTRTITMELLVDLTHEEVNEYGMELAGWEVAVQKEVEAKSAATAISNGAIKSLKALIAERAEVLNAGKEEREVKCKEVADYGARTISILRLDTGELVRERSMKEDETQKDLW